MDTALFNIIFVLPGYFSFLIVSKFKIGYGKKADVFDKTVYSLLFDLPIFILSAQLIKLKILNKLFVSDAKGYKLLTSIDEFRRYFTNDINKLLKLTILVGLVSIIIGIFWLLTISLVGKVYNHFSKCKVFNYHTIWDNSINKTASSKPIKVYKGNQSEPVARGFLTQNSTSLDDDIELEVYGVELFDECEKKNLIDTIDRIYYNSTKDIKIIIYKDDKINDFVENSENTK